MPISFVIYLQIIFNIIIIIHGEDSFDCTGYEDDTYHPVYDADDCRHYWHCIYVNTVYMHAVKRVCPAGTEFDVALRKCETSSEVDCIPPRSPHMPRTSSTTKAWKWKYSRLFSRLQWRATIPSYVTTRRHKIFDLGDAREVDTTTMIMPEIETTEQIQVLPFTLSQPTTAFSIEQLSKNLNALVLNRHRHKQIGVNFFQPGEPGNDAEVYGSTPKRRSRRTRLTTQTTSTIPSTTTQLPLTTFIFTTETTITSTFTSTSTSAITTTTTIPTTISLTTIINTEPDTTMNIHPQPRMGGQRRRNNMTLYILTSDEHKIRQFSVNHTRGILINCNQLRRRLLGRRRLRDVISTITTTTTDHSFIIKNSYSNSSIQLIDYNILLLTMLFWIFLQK